MLKKKIKNSMVIVLLNFFLGINFATDNLNYTDEQCVSTAVPMSSKDKDKIIQFTVNIIEMVSQNLPHGFKFNAKDLLEKVLLNKRYCDLFFVYDQLNIKAKNKNFDISYFKSLFLDYILPLHCIIDGGEIIVDLGIHYNDDCQKVKNNSSTGEKAIKYIQYGQVISRMLTGVVAICCLCENLFKDTESSSSIKKRIQMIQQKMVTIVYEKINK